MTVSEKIFNQENVNGVMLSLEVKFRNGTPNSRHFNLTYKNREKKAANPIFLFFLIILNILALWYVEISFMTILIIILVLALLVVFWITHSVQSESILVVPTVGIQSTIKYVFGREDNFFSWSSVDDVIINEVIKLNRVLYYLTLLIKTRNHSSENGDDRPIKLVPLFKYTKPRLPMLEEIYTELQVLLTESRHDGSAKGSGDTGLSFNKTL